MYVFIYLLINILKQVFFKIKIFYVMIKKKNPAVFLPVLSLLTSKIPLFRVNYLQTLQLFLLVSVSTFSSNTWRIFSIYYFFFLFQAWHSDFTGWKMRPQFSYTSPTCCACTHIPLYSLSPILPKWLRNNFLVKHLSVLTFL